MKNILYMESGSGYGGSAKNLMVIIKYLDRSLYNPIVVVPKVGSHIEKIIDMGVRVYRIPILKLGNISRIRQMRNKNKILANIIYYLDLLLFLINYLPTLFLIIKKEKISLVHGNNGVIDHFPVIFVARLLNIPIVLYISGTEFLTRIERVLSRWVDHFIVLNPLVMDFFQKNMGERRTSLIDNGVDLDEVPDQQIGQYFNSTKRSFGINDDEIVIGTAARIVPGKGLIEFIYAAREVIQKYKRTKFIIIGDNPLGETSFLETLKSLVKELNLSSHVVFVGWQKDIYKALQPVDIVAQISSTYPEGMSLAPIEAMALSKPVIVSDNPGYERTIIPGESGLRIPAGDVHALAVGIFQLIENPEFAKRIGSNGHKRVEQFLNARSMVNSVQAIYKTLLTP
jgi:glycosyltransferase involved in cell wall biosynthesis